MKNHIKVNEKILKKNKKWSHLKQKQKENISNCGFKTKFNNL
ncbi:hypothetical protein IK1_04349 [Bacillus cereus VD146]|uniref:Uncharacterized protein n=1 Tax=Bacillus cereus (strain VD146) TaxID=1053236 RepID=R8NIJ9_BACCX|nr:hypothetical protein IK1_04349 [Bacillus cereus VD146]